MRQEAEELGFDPYGDSGQEEFDSAVVSMVSAVSSKEKLVTSATVFDPTLTMPSLPLCVAIFSFH